uniref:Uncharacterized protein n=1 Tax=Sphaeramia orbicularis TaxID=375764 RepID=A0A672Y5N9_9TELE
MSRSRSRSRLTGFLFCVSGEEYEPSYYKLEGNGTSACLATGFSRNNGTIDKPLFNTSEAERIHGDSLYNDVVLTGPENQDQCKGETQVLTVKPSTETCQDPTVNFVSLTVLGLRLLFIKTVIFNVLMTLRLCSAPPSGACNLNPLAPPPPGF